MHTEPEQIDANQLIDVLRTRIAELEWELALSRVRLQAAVESKVEPKDG